ncbi:hypothetical protein [Ralstonia phage RP31]|uniref:Uncharacterized protein n=2 Tax=Ripduovirus RP12 TaxID=2560700 RepID=A0A1L7N114_9CAUD|nr:hypothetical protein FDH28_gp223 [Ralstonia phage RP12]BAW19172.1 hypothetical protein [Ralstonia phage RP12]BAW19458.1 hypothetical protein [Ralstonia phage RP31]
MADVTGPISTLPGHRHPVPAGMTCDDHSDRPAVARIQGETDSWGAELIDMCQECLDKHEKHVADQKDNPTDTDCDHCGPVGEQCLPTRDPDEGMAGPVYYLCSKCRKSLADYHRED